MNKTRRNELIVVIGVIVGLVADVLAILGLLSPLLATHNPAILANPFNTLLLVFNLVLLVALIWALRKQAKAMGNRDAALMGKLNQLKDGGEIDSEVNAQLQQTVSDNSYKGFFVYAPVMQKVNEEQQRR